MPGQTIGTVNVTVGSQNPRAVSISYGKASTLKGLNDVSMAGATDGDVVVYKSATDSFVVEHVDYIISIDGGTY